MKEEDKGFISCEFTVWCAFCAEWEKVGSVDQTAAVEKFKESGWKQTKENGWVCKGHTA